MSNPVQRGPGNDAFGGGALIRAAPPTSGPTGALAGPNTSTPLGGVNPPSTPFFARPNSGTNIKIPYNRVVPLSDPRASGLKAVRTNPAAKAIADPGDWYFGMHGDSQQKEYMSETDTLKATRLAFILAKKSNIGLNRPNGHHEGNTANDDDARNFSYAINSSIAPTLPGTQKLQKLCSFEYLQRYIDAMANRPGPGGLVHLSTKGNNPLFNNVAGAPRGPAGQGPLSDGSITDWAGNSNYPGVLGETLAEGLSRGRKRKAALDAVPAVGAAGGPDDTNGGAIKTAQGNIQPAAADVSVSNLRSGDQALLLAYRAALQDVHDMGGARALDDAQKTYSKIAEIQAIYGHKLAFSGLPPPNASLCNIGDLGRTGGAIGSAALPNPSVGLGPQDATVDDARAPSTLFAGDDANLQKRYLVEECARLGNAYPVLGQGIFTRDEGPFLRGRGVEAAAAVTKLGQIGDPKTGRRHYNIGRCRGDEVAFAVLERELEQKHHLFDWTPDGLLMSKLDNVPLDKLEDQRIDARDGMLYNVCIQGPSLATNWTGDPRMEVLPMDKVFIVVVADLQSGVLSGAAVRGAGSVPVGFEAPGVVRAATQATQLTAFLENANLLAVRTLLATAAAAEANGLDRVNEVVANPAGGPPVARPDSSYRARLNALLTELQDSVNYTNATFSDDQKAAQFAMWSTLFKTAPAVDAATGLLMQYERAPAAIQRMETDLKAMARAVAQAMSTGLVEADVAAAVGAQITLTTTGNPDVTGADKIAKFLVADIVEFIDGTTVQALATPTNSTKMPRRRWRCGPRIPRTAQLLLARSSTGEASVREGVAGRAGVRERAPLSRRRVVRLRRGRQRRQAGARGGERHAGRQRRREDSEGRGARRGVRWYCQVEPRGAADLR